MGCRRGGVPDPAVTPVPGSRGPTAVPATTSLPPRRCHHVPAGPGPRVSLRCVFSLAVPGQECFPLPSESGGRNCWNSDRLSNSANFILQTKGTVPAPSAAPAGARAAGRRGVPAPNSCPGDPPLTPQPPLPLPPAKRAFPEARRGCKIALKGWDFPPRHSTTQGSSLCRCVPGFLQGFWGL